MSSNTRYALYDEQTGKIILPLTVVKWGEIEGTPSDQTDIKLPTGSSEFQFTYLDGTTESITVATL